MNAIQRREQSARRQLAKHGLRLQKTPARSSSRDLYGVGYMVSDARTSTLVIGATHRAYDADLEDVEALVSEIASI